MVRFLIVLCLLFVGLVNSSFAAIVDSVRESLKKTAYPDVETSYILDTHEKPNYCFYFPNIIHDSRQLNVKTITERACEDIIPSGHCLNLENKIIADDNYLSSRIFGYMNEASYISLKSERFISNLYDNSVLETTEMISTAFVLFSGGLIGLVGIERTRTSHRKTSSSSGITERIIPELINIKGRWRVA